jgi:predicted O-methyltransferase YrrM
LLKIKNMDIQKHIEENFEIDKSKGLPFEIIGFGRDKMALLMNEMGVKIGAEIGVCYGTYSETLCKAIPGLKLYGIEFGEPYRGYSDMRSWSTFNKFKEQSKTKLAPFDFVYIDANHEYSFVFDDITEWTKKVKPGGVVYGHDYDSYAIRTLIDGRTIVKGPMRKDWKVKQAIHDYTEQNNITTWYLLGLFKDLARDHARSWMFIKQ